MGTNRRGQQRYSTKCNFIQRHIHLPSGIKLETHRHRLYLSLSLLYGPNKILLCSALGAAGDHTRQECLAINLALLDGWAQALHAHLLLLGSHFPPPAEKYQLEKLGNQARALLQAAAVYGARDRWVGQPSRFAPRHLL